jgi:chromate reductase
MKVLTFALSLRKDSYNKKLLVLATEVIKKNHPDASIEQLDLLDYAMPAYDGDVEVTKGLPEAAERFKQKLDEVQALIIASPEYNFSYPGHFKNTFDWISRFQPFPWSNKAVLLLSASMGLVGGNRGLWHLRVPFEYCNAFVHPGMFSLASAHQAFDEAGALLSADQQKRLEAMTLSFMQFSKNLKY